MIVDRKQISKTELVHNFKTKIEDVAEHGSLEVLEGGFCERDNAKWMLAMLSDEEWEEEAYIDTMTEEERMAYGMWQDAEHQIDCGEFSGGQKMSDPMGDWMGENK